MWNAFSLMGLNESNLEFIKEASEKWRYWLFRRVRTGFYSDVPPIIIWIVRLETFWRPSNIKVSFSSSFIPFSSSEPDYSLISRKDFLKKSDQKPIKYLLIKMIKENQETIIEMKPGTFLKKVLFWVKISKRQRMGVPHKSQKNLA